ncbi:zinc finger, CCHC-type containing protein [Tanacetum coccineum]
MEWRFLSQKGSEGGRGVKEKQQVSANDSAKDVAYVVDEPVLSSLDGPTVEKVIVSGNNNAVSERFANTIYGFFLGKRVTYLVVENNVKNTWSKYGLVKSMLNSSNELFFFKFSSNDEMDAMLENGPWFIRDTPFILQKWNPDVNLLKEDVGNVLIWVKFHGVPMTTYAIAMIKLRANVGLKDTIVVAMSKLVGECPKKIVSDVVKNLKNPKKAARGVQKQDEVFRQEFSNSNPFDALNSLEINDALAEKIRRQMLDGKLMLVDDADNPLPKVVSTVNLNSDSEVEDVLNEIARFMASTSLKSGSDMVYGNKSLLE